MTRYLPDTAPIPALTEFNHDFFTSARLMLQQCADCSTIQHPPDDVCYNCQGWNFQSKEATGPGTIYSYIIVHNPPSPAWADRVPYPVVLVELDEHPGIRIIGNVINAAPEHIAIGQPVRVVFEEVDDEESGDKLQIPQWEIT